MAKVSFTHPSPHLKPGLTIDVNPDQVTWAYGLNTAVYPTFGGEVVQILSVYFDDMTVAGTVATYADLERIYNWFLRYMQIATQGRDSPSFDQHPVTFTYYERNWTFWIWPKALPGFQYGRDVVAPTWTLVAAVKEPDATLASQIMQYAAFNAHHSDLQQFGKATADFGKTGDLVHNPWASPDADPANKGQTINQWLTSDTKKLADTFSSFVGDYADGQLSHLPAFAKPPNYLGGVSGQTNNNHNPTAGKGTKQGRVKG